MADKRINALTTTSASVGDDYFAIDGATNGTRALSAFSPTFGGNVVVTGTLTSNSTLSTAAGLSCQNADITGGYITLRGFGTQDGGLIFLGQAANNNYINSSATAISTAIANTAVVRAQAEGWRVLTTTASTTTSSGALVIGNGTSGGLGVGGAGNFGGAVGVGGATVASRLHVYESTSGTGDSNGITIEQASTADAALQFLLTGVQRWTVGIDNSDSDKFKIGTGAIGSADRLTIDTSGNATFAGGLTTGADTSLVAIYVPGDSALRAAAGKLYLDTRTTDGGDIVLRPRTNAALTLAAATGNATFASTTNASSTSFAALVVSGGVGVAKRIVSGEGLTTNGDNETHISFVRNGTVSIGPTSAAAPKLSISSGVVLAAATQNLAAWGDVGAQFAVSGSVLTDTQSSGTVSRCVLNSFASTNVAAAGTTTFTQAATLFVAGAPTAGTNVTITNAYAIYTAAGRINFQGLPTSSAGLQAGTLWNDGGTLKVA